MTTWASPAVDNRSPGSLLPARPLRVVLDTNVVLDGWVFGHPGSRVWLDGLATGQIQWLACARMRDELLHTLDHPALARWQPDSRRVLGAFDRWALLLPAPATLPALRCRDPDDQVFIDLAVEAGAQALLTRDRALLRLARQAARRGVAVLTPEAWLSRWQGAGGGLEPAPTMTVVDP